MQNINASDHMAQSAKRAIDGALRQVSEQAAPAVRKAPDDATPTPKAEASTEMGPS